MNLLFKTFLEDRLYEYCTDLADGYATLSTAPVDSVADIPEAKRYDIEFFGAIVGLALVHSHALSKINPLLLVYLLSGCDIDSIQKHDVMEFFPSIFHSLVHWAGHGHGNDDLADFQSFFATFFNLQVCVSICKHLYL